nr:hypothetical protein [Tanacetum cinerariifolium]
MGKKHGINDAIKVTLFDVIRKHRWLEFLSDYDCEIHYHPGKANVMADALTEAINEENVKEENLRGMNKVFETRPDETLCIKKRSWLPRLRGLRDLIMHESHKSKYSIHPKSDKLYHDLKRLYSWPNMKAEITTDSQLTGPEIIYETNEMSIQIKRRIQAARDLQKSYVDVSHKRLEFQVGYKVMLKVSP